MWKDKVKCILVEVCATIKWVMMGMLLVMKIWGS